jgi:ABC-2 type transport system permease protein
MRRRAIDLARRDLQQDLRSPWAWVLLGLFAFLAGWVYMTSLASFIDQSAQANPGQAINVNDLLIRPFLLSLATVALFVLPLITIRTCPDDEGRRAFVARPGPADAFAVAAARFTRSLVLYAAMLLVTLVNVAALSLYGSLEWLWIAGGYLGLLLMGAALIAVGLFFASLARNPFVAAMPTFGFSLLVWTAKRILSVSPVRAEAMLRDLSFANRFDDFAKGVVDSGNVVYFLSVALFGLLLTAAAVQAETGATESGSSDDASHAG